MDDALARLTARAGLRGWHARGAALGSVALCLGLWIGAKTVDQDERGNAERRAIFVGLWPPTLYLIGETLDRQRAGASGTAIQARRRWRTRPSG